MPGEIHFSQEAGIATLTLSNPDKLNAVDAGMWRGLQRRMSELNANPDLRCVVLRGAGDKAFAAGGDIEEFLTVRATVDDALHYHEDLALQEIADRMRLTESAVRSRLHRARSKLREGLAAAMVDTSAAA